MAIIEKTIDFRDGYYIVRSEGGDTICGACAHNAMFAMNRHYAYVNQSMEERIKFLEEYKQQTK